MELKDKTAVIKQGKTVTEAPVTVQNDSQKFPANRRALNGMQVEEIRIGGTSTRDRVRQNIQRHQLKRNSCFEASSPRASFQAVASSPRHWLPPFIYLARSRADENISRGKIELCSAFFAPCWVLCFLLPPAQAATYLVLPFFNVRRIPISTGWVRAWPNRSAKRFLRRD